MTNPALERITLNVGVTGHRNLTADARATLSAEIGRVLALLEGAARSIAADRGTSARVRVVSSIADGADQLVARAALERGFSLHCPLPFKRDDYESDMASESVKLFRDLLASAERVLELDCPRSRADEAYELAGRVTLEHSDILLAVWDGAPARGRGGTAQIVEEALAAGMPVVWIPTAGTADTSLLTADGSSVPISDDVMRDGLSHAIDPLHGDAAAQRAEREYVETKLPRWQPSRLLLHVWSCMLTIVTWKANRTTAGVVPPHPYPELVDTYRAEFRRADSLATHFTAIYRGAFVTNYLLAAFAVMCTVLALIRTIRIGAYAASHDHIVHGWGYAELVAVVVIVLITFVANRNRWHERSIDYRFLAEQLRQMLYLAPLGHTSPNSRPQAHDAGGDPRNTWMSRYFRRVVRAEGLPDARHDATNIAPLHVWTVHEAINSQVRYHRGTATRMHVFGHRMHVLGLVMFTLAGAAVVAHLVRPLFSDSNDPWPAILTALLPVWGSALFAIQNHGEFERIERRSGAMADYLERMARETAARSDRTVDSLELYALTIPLARAAMDEVTDWRTVFASRPIRPPG